MHSSSQLTETIITVSYLTLVSLAGLFGSLTINFLMSQFSSLCVKYQHDRVYNCTYPSQYAIWSVNMSIQLWYFYKNTPVLCLIQAVLPPGHPNMASHSISPPALDHFNNMSACNVRPFQLCHRDNYNSLSLDICQAK